jgi:hypothetical protein
VIALLTAAIMEANGYRAIGFPSRLATSEQIVDNARLFVSGVALLANGEFFGREIGVGSAVLVIAAGVGLAGVIIAVRAGVIAIRRPPAQADPASTPRRLYLAFWAATVASTALAFLLSEIPAQIELLSFRYLVAPIYAACAVVPLLAARTFERRVTVSLLITFICVLSAVRVVETTDSLRRATAAWPMVADGRRAMAYLASEGIREGYANYWNANPLTWKTGVQVRGARPCLRADGAAVLCPFHANMVSTWYRPEARVRTFVLVDPTLPDPLTSMPYPAFGPPSEVRSFGQLKVYVYPYDVAARFGPA